MKDVASASKLVPLLMVVALSAFGFAALDQYNVTWDEALGDLFFGERYLSFFTTFDSRYLDFESDPYPPGHSPDLGRSPFRNRPWEYYPVANTLAAATSTVLSRWLGLLDPFDGFHAVNLLFAALLILVFLPFLHQRFGAVTAIAAGGLLFTLPRVVCHLLANIKDFPLMVLFTLTLVVFMQAYERGSARGIVLAGALWGLALGTKANALFLPAVPLGVVLIARRPASWQGRKVRLALAIVGAALLGTALMVALWPYLWADPIGRFREHLTYIGFRRGYTRAESLAPVLQALLLTTPPLTLVLFVLGLLPLGRRLFQRDRTAWLLALWIAVVLGRYLPPQAVNFDGVRHFLELFPAFAAVAGLGAASLAVWLARAAASRVAPHTLKACVLAVLLLPGVWTVLRTHPFQIAYWNALAGGLGGARAAGLPQASDYWGMSYRLGMAWLNENAPRDARLAVPVIEHAVRLVAPQRLRPDLQLLPVSAPHTPRIPPARLAMVQAAAREGPLYVMFVERRDWMNALMADCLRRLEPEVAWYLDGAPVLLIFRYTPPTDGSPSLPRVPSLDDS